MIRHTQLEPCFVKTIPRELEPGVLYVSMEYGTVVHSCCCGCGLEIVTPLTPTDWQLTFNGESVSLWPSVGNWNLPCRSHYIIKNNRVIEAGSWRKSRVDAAIKRDKAVKKQFYSQLELPPVADQGASPEPEAEKLQHMDEGLWARIQQWLR